LEGKLNALRWDDNKVQLLQAGLAEQKTRAIQRLVYHLSPISLAIRFLILSIAFLL
jgi:hypothetical protein